MKEFREGYIKQENRFLELIEKIREIEKINNIKFREVNKRRRGKK